VFFGRGAKNVIYLNCDFHVLQNDFISILCATINFLLKMFQHAENSGGSKPGNDKFDDNQVNPSRIPLPPLAATLP
jgi:hypothetical protein